MGIEPMRLSPILLEKISLTGFGHPRYDDIQIIITGNYVDCRNRTHSGYPIAPQAITFPFGQTHLYIIINI